MIEPDHLMQQGAGGEAAGALRSYLRRGLQKALAGERLGEADLDDLTHDALIRILEKLETFRGESRFATWAMAVAIRVAFSALRSRRYRERLQSTPLEADDHASPATRWSDPTRRLDHRGVISVLNRAIDRDLSARQRQAVIGELQGIPSEELAKRLGITRNAFYKLHHDARRKLRQRIVDAGFTENDVREELGEASKES